MRNISYRAFAVGAAIALCGLGSTGVATAQAATMSGSIFSLSSADDGNTSVGGSNNNGGDNTSVGGSNNNGGDNTSVGGSNNCGGGNTSVGGSNNGCATTPPPTTTTTPPPTTTTTTPPPTTTTTTPTSHTTSSTSTHTQPPTTHPTQQPTNAPTNDVQNVASGWESSTVSLAVVIAFLVLISGAAIALAMVGRSPRVNRPGA